MRSNIRFFLAILLFAGATCAVAQEVNPTPPVPQQEAPPAPPAPLPDTQSTLPTPVPTMVPTDALPTPTAGTPAPTLTPTKVLAVDTTVVRGKVPTPRARSEKKTSTTADRKPETGKALEAAAAAAVAADSSGPQPPSPGAPAAPSGVLAPDLAAPAPAPDAAPSEATAANAEPRTQSMKSGGLWIMLGIFVICVIGMATYVSRRSGGAKELSIFAGGLGSEHRSPLVTGRHLS